MYQLKDLGLNPLESGRVVKLEELEIDNDFLNGVLIPLNRVVLLNEDEDAEDEDVESEAKGLNPLESGRVVKFTNKGVTTTLSPGLNPLESGRVVK